MADSCFITNRRQLLIGMSASVLVSFTAVRTEPVEVRVIESLRPPFDKLRTNGGEENDPAVRAYAALLEVEAAFMDEHVLEGSETYDVLLTALEEAEARLEQGRALSPSGIRAKLDRMASICAWEPERAIRDCPLAMSIVRDFARLTASSISAV